MTLNRLAIYISLSLSISLLLVLNAFNGLAPNEILYIGDQYFPFSTSEIHKYFLYLLSSANFGFINSWQMIILFWDSLLFLFLHSLGLDLQTVQKFAFMSYWFLSIMLSILGFTKLANLDIMKGNSNAKVLVISLWYVFNPYTLTLWHGGVYNLGTTFSYALSPLIIYFLYKYLSVNSRKKTRLYLFALCASLFFASFVFWIFVPFVFFLIGFLAMCFVFRIIEFKKGLVKLLVLSVCYLAVATPIIYALIFRYINLENHENPFEQTTFGNLKGGILYQAMFLFSWGIYNFWSPRSMYPFAEYFFSSRYVISVISFYALLLLGFIGLIVRDYSFTRKVRFTIGLLLIFAVILFLAKGPQEPYGWIFIYLFKNFLPFSIFRSADQRFGFLIILTLSLILIIVSRYLKAIYFVPILVLIIIVQNIHIISGIALKGMYIPNVYDDRIISIPDNYIEIAQRINSQTTASDYVLLLPSEPYTRFNLKENEYYVGQDILAKILKPNVVYLNEYGTGINYITYGYYKDLLTNEHSLNLFPITHIVLRKDIYCEDCISKYKPQEAINFTDKVYEDNLFSVYTTSGISDSQTKDVSYRFINPVMGEIEIKDVNPETEYSFMQPFSYDENWRLYKQYNRGLIYQFARSLMDETPSNLLHKTQNNMNGWIVSGKYLIDNDLVTGSDANLVLMYPPQLIFFSLLLLVILVFTISAFYLFIYYRHNDI